MVIGGPRDRGQVILIGAIVIAFVLLGVVVVLNGVVYTEEVSSSASSGSVSSAETMHEGMASTIQDVVVREYDDDYLVGDEDAAERNITAYLNATNELHSDTSGSVIVVRDVTVETDDDELERAKNDTIGPSAGNGVGNNIWMNQSENVAEEVYRFTYEVDGDQSVYVEFVGVSEEIEVDQRGGETEILYDGNTCQFSHQDVTIDFLTGDVNGEDRDCNPGIVGVVDDVGHTNIDRVAFKGTQADQDIGEYDIIADDIESGNAAWIDGTESPVSFVDVTYTYRSHDINVTETTRITGFGEL